MYVGTGSLAKAAQQCVGGEESEDGLGNKGEKCCPTLSWSNGTYQQVKGQQSWQYYNEQRVRHALSILLDPQHPYASGVAAFAVANAASVPSSLMTELQNVRQSFGIKFPFSRWSQVPNAVASQACDGSYSAWVAPVTGVHLAAATPQALAAIKGVPGSYGNSNVLTMPTVGELLGVTGQDGGSVVAKAPLQALIDAFGKGLSYTGRGGVSVTPLPPPVKTYTGRGGVQVTPGSPSAQQDADVPGGGGNQHAMVWSKGGPPWAMIGLGVLVLGAGAYVMTRRS